MFPDIHGTNDVPGKHHPVLDIRLWENEFPLKDSELRDHLRINSPGDIAHREQAIRLAKTKGDLGPSVPADIFVWAEIGHYQKPWLTRIGGRPWRPAGRPWPRDDNGVPLVFLGQICFADSADILPCKLPGDVALIFGACRGGSVSLSDGSALEWSPLTIETPESSGIPWTGELPFQYHGVLHRTVQYTDWKVAELPFKALGDKHGGWGLHSIQATSVSTYASLPQGWPFRENDGKTLIATLNSFYFLDKWPVCDIRRGVQRVYGNGDPRDLVCDDTRSLNIFDVGCILIYRDKAGTFKVDYQC